MVKGFMAEDKRITDLEEATSIDADDVTLVIKEADTNPVPMKVPRSVGGLMTAAEREKLDAIAPGSVDLGTIVAFSIIFGA